MGRILSVDYGKKRTGLAVTDPSQIIANGLTTIATPVLFAFLEDYIKRENVDFIVMGLPKQLNGQPSENQQRVRQFAARWQKAHPEVPIDFYDERFTSVIAHRAMIDSGISRKARQNKALVDEISATIILQDYLHSIQTK